MESWATQCTIGTPASLWVSMTRKTEIQAGGAYTCLFGSEPLSKVIVKYHTINVMITYMNLSYTIVSSGLRVSMYAWMYCDITYNNEVVPDKCLPYNEYIV